MSHSIIPFFILQYFCIPFCLVFLCILLWHNIKEVVNMFEIEKYKDSNVKLSIRLPESIDNTLRKIAEAENMSFNNVLVSCIKYALDNTDLTKYEKKQKGS